MGPPLDRVAERVYLAGRNVKTSENRMTWIRPPQQVEGGTAMPERGLSDADAENLAACLHPLRR